MFRPRVLAGGRECRRSCRHSRELITVRKCVRAQAAVLEFSQALSPLIYSPIVAEAGALDDAANVEGEDKAGDPGKARVDLMC